jgi:hypothetical protein
MPGNGRARLCAWSVRSRLKTTGVDLTGVEASLILMCVGGKTFPKASRGGIKMTRLTELASWNPKTLGVVQARVRTRTSLRTTDFKSAINQQS